MTGCVSRRGIARSCDDSVEGIFLFCLFVCLFVVVGEPSTPISVLTAPLCAPASSEWGFPFPHIIYQHFSFVFLISILLRVSWNLKANLICISLMARDVEYHLLAICISSLTNSVLDYIT